MTKLRVFHCVYFVYRDIIAEHLLTVAGGYMVGGYNTTIEIDESMFGTYHFRNFSNYV